MVMMMIMMIIIMMMMMNDDYVDDDIDNDNYEDDYYDDDDYHNYNKLSIIVASKKIYCLANFWHTYINGLHLSIISLYSYHES